MWRIFARIRHSTICTLLVLFFFTLNVVFVIAYLLSFLSSDTNAARFNLGPSKIYNTNSYAASTSSINSNTVSCQVYIAPSTIPDGGLGLYSGVTVFRDSPVGYPSSDIMIPVGYYLGEPYRGIYINDYSWNDKTKGLASKTLIRDEGKISLSMIPNFGSVANHFAIPNIDFHTRRIRRAIRATLSNHEASNNLFHDDSLFNAFGPTYGSFTPFHNYQVYAQRNIDPGQELFLDYGEAYFYAREDQYGKIPKSTHYYIAEQVIIEFHKIMLHYSANLSHDDSKNTVEYTHHDTKIEEQLWTLIQTYARPKIKRILPRSIKKLMHSHINFSSFSTSASSTEKMKSEIIVEFRNLAQKISLQHQQKPQSDKGTGRNMFIMEDFWKIFHMAIDPYLYAALPTTSILNCIADCTSTVEQTLDDIISLGGIVNYMDQNKHRRSMPWLQEHGVCVDNLRVDGSTILDAGRGAFSKRFLHKGSVITPCPLVQMHKSALEKNITTWDFVNTQKGATDNATKVTYITYKNLLLNYCFGHPQSTVRLCPYGSVSHLMNHANSKDQVNAEIRWSSSTTLMNMSRLNMSSDELLHLKRPARIAFDIVATRNILPNEEIFIYYGKEWEKAWENYKNQWNNNYGWASLPSSELQKLPIDNTSIIDSLQDTKTNDDLENKDKPPNSKKRKAACYYNFEASTILRKSLDTFPNSEDDVKSTVQQRQIDSYAPSFWELQDDDDNFIKDATNSRSRTTSNANQHEEVEYNWAFQNKITQSLGGLYPCDVYFKEENELQNKSKEKDYFFTRIYYHHPESHGVTKRNTKSRYVRFVPSNAIILVNDGWVDAGSTALNDSPSFRHYMVIPDQILPTAWIDKQGENG